MHTVKSLWLQLLLFSHTYNIHNHSFPHFLSHTPHYQSAVSTTVSDTRYFFHNQPPLHTLVALHTKVCLSPACHEDMEGEKCQQPPATPLKIYIYRNNPPFSGTLRKKRSIWGSKTNIGEEFSIGSQITNPQVLRPRLVLTGGELRSLLTHPL